MHTARWTLLGALALALSACTSAPVETPVEPPFSGDAVATSRGDLIIHPLNHATFALGWAGKVVYVDPVGGAARFEGLPSPDVVLVTDVHGDHLSADTLAAVVRSSTVLIVPQAVKDTLPEALASTARVLGNGQSTEVAGFGVEAVPMYNLTAERLQYHAKGRGNGYLLTLGGKRVYIAGDTEDIPEMRALSGIDVAFIPMNLPFTMTVEQAADAVRAFKPKVVYPYHSRGSDLEAFTQRVGTDVGVEVRVRAWY